MKILPDPPSDHSAPDPTILFIIPFFIYLMFTKAWPIALITLICIGWLIYSATRKAQPTLSPDEIKKKKKRDNIFAKVLFFYHSIIMIWVSLIVVVAIGGFFYMVLELLGIIK